MSEEKLADNANQTADGFSVVHKPEQKRFELEVDGKTAVTEYMLVGDTYIFTHTEVPIGLEGRGVGGALVKGSLEYLKENNFTTAPLCPFVKAYISKHPEYQSLVKLGG